MEHLLSWHTFDKTQKAVLKIGIFRALVDVFHCVPGALKCVSCSVFFFQTEHLPLQTQFQDREVGGLQHSVSNMVLQGGGGGLPGWSWWLPCLLKYHLISMKIIFFTSLLSEHPQYDFVKSLSLLACLRSNGVL